MLCSQLSSPGYGTTPFFCDTIFLCYYLDKLKVQLFFFFLLKQYLSSNQESKILEIMDHELKCSICTRDTIPSHMEGHPPKSLFLTLCFSSLLSLLAYYFHAICLSLQSYFRTLFLLHLLSYLLFSYISKLFYYFNYLIFRAAPAAYGGSQARVPIGATAAGLSCSHSNE